MSFINNNLPQAQPTKVALPSNYISAYTYASVYRPDTLPVIAKKYGTQRLNFIHKGLRSEFYFSGDTYKWNEEGRLRAKHTGITRAGNNFTTPTAHTFKVNDNVMLLGGTLKVQAIVTATPSSTTFTALPITVSGYTGFPTNNITAFKYGTEYPKGSDIEPGSLISQTLILSNSPKIHRTYHQINGSDFGQLTWLQDENGGWYWTNVDIENARYRHEDEVELMMLIERQVEVGSAAHGAGKKGTEGIIDALYKRGLVWQGVITSLADIDTIIKRLRQEGAISEYLIMCDTNQSLLLDDMLGAINAYSNTTFNYGVFQNNMDLFLNLEFQAFKRGGVNFMKSTYKLLDDIQSIGAIQNNQGKPVALFIPMGSKQVYENGTATQNVPYLSIGYHKTQNEVRQSKVIMTGSVGLSQPTSQVDAQEISFLTDFMPRIIGANNFVFVEGT